MLIPTWLVISIVVIAHVTCIIKCLGSVFYILTTNRVGVLSESPIMWSLIISSAGVIGYLTFRHVLISLHLMHYELYFKLNGWKLPTIHRQYVQECYVNTLCSIWGFNNGIRGKMLNNWKHLE